MLKVGYFADGPWGHNTFEKLINRKDEIKICFVVVRNDYRDPELIKLSEKNGIPCLWFKNVNSKEAIDEFRSYETDMLISMSFNQIIKKELINLNPYGFINCHAGKLPEYRGRNILNWALINDESEFGITVHYIDEGIDTGDIILQRTYPISENDNYRTLLETAYIECAEILNDAITLIINDQVRPIRQEDIGHGFYCGMRGEGDEIINWNQDTRKVHNFIRALTFPGICATTTLDDKKIRILTSSYEENWPEYIGIPGQVVGRDSEGCIVKTKDKTLKITKILDENNIEKIPSFAIGKRLGKRSTFER